MPDLDWDDNARANRADEGSSATSIPEWLQRPQMPSLADGLLNSRTRMSNLAVHPALIAGGNHSGPIGELDVSPSGLVSLPALPNLPSLPKLPSLPVLPSLPPPPVFPWFMRSGVAQPERQNRRGTFARLFGASR
jgi:hypothetical protein